MSQGSIVRVRSGPFGLRRAGALRSSVRALRHLTGTTGEAAEMPQPVNVPGVCCPRRRARRRVCLRSKELGATCCPGTSLWSLGQSLGTGQAGHQT